MATAKYQQKQRLQAFQRIEDKLDFIISALGYDVETAADGQLIYRPNIERPDFSAPNDEGAAVASTSKRRGRPKKSSPDSERD